MGFIYFETPGISPRTAMKNGFVFCEQKLYIFYKEIVMSVFIFAHYSTFMKKKKITRVDVKNCHQKFLIYS